MAAVGIRRDFFSREKLESPSHPPWKNSKEFSKNKTRQNKIPELRSKATCCKNKIAIQ